MPSGSSPRVRGAEGAQIMSNTNTGIIPACAGSRLYRRPRRRWARDHPRVCGEQSLPSQPSDRRSGSSPRVRGAASFPARIGAIRGIIPACAGSSAPLASRTTRRRDHPRVCGEQSSPPRAESSRPGSSPRVRGAALASNGGRSQYGIIPACAGSSQRCSMSWRYSGDHPRVCGEQTSALTPYWA